MSHKCLIVFGQKIFDYMEWENCHGEADSFFLSTCLAVFFVQHHKGIIKPSSSTLYWLFGLLVCIHDALCCRNWRNKSASFSHCCKLVVFFWALVISDAFILAFWIITINPGLITSYDNFQKILGHCFHKPACPEQFPHRSPSVALSAVWKLIWLTLFQCPNFS